MISNEDEVLSKALLWIRSGRTVVFDLDNTLYPEISFLELAYKSFSKEMSDQYPVDADELAEYMVSRIQHGFRQTLLQDLCTFFRLRMDRVEGVFFDCLRLRYLGQELSLFDWALQFFSNILNYDNCALITNGNVLQQKNKIRHLHQLHMFPSAHIVFAAEFSPKPSIKSALHLKKIMKCKDPLYIGDELTDEKFAKDSGWSFVRIRY